MGETQGEPRVGQSIVCGGTAEGSLFGEGYYEVDAFLGDALPVFLLEVDFAVAVSDQYFINILRRER